MSACKPLDTERRDTSVVETYFDVPPVWSVLVVVFAIRVGAVGWLPAGFGSIHVKLLAPHEPYTISGAQLIFS